MSSIKNVQNRSIKSRLDGKTPLRSSINLINNRNQNSLNSLKNNQSIHCKNEKCEPKVSLTEQTSNVNLNQNKETIKSKIDHDNKQINKLTDNKSIKKLKSHQNVGKKRIKNAIKIILNKDERIKRWLTTKGPIQDSKYWLLYSERLSGELKDTLDELEELELENELLRAEYEEMTKLAENAYKLNRLIDKIGLNQLKDHNEDQECGDEKTV